MPIRASEMCATPLSHPLQCEIAEGVTNKTLVYDKNPAQCREAVIAAAKSWSGSAAGPSLPNAATFAFSKGMCARQWRFRLHVQPAPVLNSAGHRPRKSVGIVCAQKQFLSEEHLVSVGIDPKSNHASPAPRMSTASVNLTIWESSPQARAPRGFL